MTRDWWQAPRDGLARLRGVGTGENRVLLASGLAVGVGAGVGAIIFRALITLFGTFFFGTLRTALSGVVGPAAVIVLPALGGLVYGPLIYRFAREARGHGVPEVMAAVALRGGRIRPNVAIVKSLASALCIGSGGSVGREGPIVQIGSTIGSVIGQVFKMSDQRIRTLVACGAAGGIAATFNAPIAGVFFALELILGEFSARSFGVVVIASVTAAVIGRSAFGDVPAFVVPAYQLIHLSEYAFYAILGVLGGVVGVGFTRTLYWFEDAFDRIRIPEWSKPVPGGLALGLLGLFIPQIFGVGYDAMGDALLGRYGLGLLLLLVVAKTLAVSLTIGSGGSGGVFAPSLFVGAMLGAAWGTLLGQVFPGVPAAPGAYGLVGMGAVFAGSARAPITAVVILFEMTGDYRIILPLMLAVVLGTATSEVLSRDTIYTLKLRRRGIDLQVGREVDPLRGLRVSEAMATDVPLVPRDLTVTEAAEQLAERGQEALLVLDDAGRLAGIVTSGDIERTLLDNTTGARIGEIASYPVVTLFPDETLSHALHQLGLHDFRQLPVVARDAPTRPIGLLRRGDVIGTYSRTLRERLESRREHPLSPQQLRGTQLVETVVAARNRLANRRLGDLHLPGETLVVTIQRGERQIIPRGDTIFLVGDRVTLLARAAVIAELQEWLAALPADAAETRARTPGGEG